MPDDNRITILSTAGPPNLFMQMAQQEDHQPDQVELWAKCLLHWLQAVESRRGSTRSREEYQKSVQLFFAFCAPKLPAEITGGDCQEWVASMQAAGLAKTTIRARLAAVSSFYGFACKQFEAYPGRYLHDFNPATLVTRPHVNPYEKSQGLTVEQVKQLLKGFDRSTVAGSRDLALVSFYVYTGRRCAEVARLCWRDIRTGAEAGEWEYHYIGKGNKTNWRPVPGPVWSNLEHYLKISQRWATMQSESPLFIALGSRGLNSGQPLQPRSVRLILDQASRSAGLGHLKVHSLRHTAAKLRRRSGSSVEEVSEFLDHSNLGITQVYLNATEAKKDTGWKSVQNLLED